MTQLEFDFGNSGYSTITYKPLDYTKFYIQNSPQALKLMDITPSYTMSFHNKDKVVGTFDWNGPELKFTGDANPSAKVFIDWAVFYYKGTKVDKLQVAYDYIQACQTQSCYTRKLEQALQLLCPDNTLFSVADHIHDPYLELVTQILGDEAMEWIYYWQYESDYGTESRDFVINGTEYNTQDITLYKYLEATCGLTK